MTIDTTDRAAKIEAWRKHAMQVLHWPDANHDHPEATFVVSRRTVDAAVALMQPAPDDSRLRELREFARTLTKVTGDGSEACGFNEARELFIDKVDEMLLSPPSPSAAAPVAEAGASEARIVGSPAHVELWDAIGDVVSASGGKSCTSAARQRAVGWVEDALRKLLAESKAPAEGVDDKCESVDECARSLRIIARQAAKDAVYAIVSSPDLTAAVAHLAPKAEAAEIASLKQQLAEANGHLDALRNFLAQQQPESGLKHPAKLPVGRVIGLVSQLREQLAAAQSASRSAVEGALQRLRADLVEDRAVMKRDYEAATESLARGVYTTEMHTVDRTLGKIDRLIAEAKKGAT